MAELSDTDSSFDLNVGSMDTHREIHNGIAITDDEDIFQDDPLRYDLHRSNNNNNTISLFLRNNSSLLNKVKSWFDTKTLSQSKLNKLNNRGIPLYDLDTDENLNRIIHSTNDNNDILKSFDSKTFPSFSRKWSRGRKMFTLIRFLKWIIIMGLLITFMVHIILRITWSKNSNLNQNNDITKLFSTTNKHLYNSKISFNPNKLYSNGTHEFYPLTIVINLRYMSSEQINKDHSPFLYDMVYPNENKLNNVSMNTIIGELEPNFPYDSNLQDWCMVTGNYPINNGMLKDDIKNLKAENVTIPIWNTIDKVFANNNNNNNTSIIKSFGWTHFKNDENHCHDGEYLDSKGKIDEVIKLIDIIEKEERPQLILLTMNDLMDSIIHGEDQISAYKKINHIDKLLHKLVYELRHRNLLVNLTNIIILSDSGSGTENIKVSNQDDTMNNEEKPIKKLELRQLFKLEEENSNKDAKKIYKNLLKKIDRINNHEGRLISIKIKDTNDRNQIYRMLKTKIDSSQVSLYIKDNLPKEYNINFQNPPKIDKIVYESMDDIWLVPKNPYLLVENTKDIAVIQENSIFIGQGPYFHDVIVNYMDNNRYLMPFNNIAIYDIISSLVGLNAKDRNPNRDKYTIQYTSELNHYVEIDNTIKIDESSTTNSISSTGPITNSVTSSSTNRNIITKSSLIPTLTTTFSSLTSSRTTNSKTNIKTTTLVGTETTTESINHSTQESDNKSGNKNKHENDNNNGGGNHNLIDSMLDYLKETEEEIIDIFNDIIDDIYRDESVDRKKA